MKISETDLAQIFSVVETTGTLTSATQFLKKKGIAPYSANSWRDFREKRVAPALEAGSLTRRDLLELVSDCEEYGRQHVFLYKTTKVYASAVVNSDELQAKLKKIGRLDLLTSPPVLASPENLTLAEVRLDQMGGSRRALVIKAVKGRIYRDYLGEKRDGRFITRTYEELEERAVNVLRIQDDGFAELRVQSYQNSGDYTQDIESMWSLVAPLVEQIKFGSVPLERARLHLLVNRKQYSSLIRHARSQVRNDKGTTATLASSGFQQNLYDDEGAEKALTGFSGVGDIHCDASNLFWLKGGEARPAPSEDILTRIVGEVNEYNVSSRCSRGDYEYVLEQIRDTIKQAQ